ncbi:hypothetical protein CEXT_297191 [Caerostris extrusa]|uniref:Uncharacterized protein n=1 Tax=Caerostris extrusa TaxID=172846 RepID=A0AAV4MHC6_CAEEX|nr:hypothetical protein CEXT_297191 [Caerostris extrusa]
MIREKTSEGRSKRPSQKAERGLNCCELLCGGVRLYPHPHKKEIRNGYGVKGLKALLSDFRLKARNSLGSQLLTLAWRRSVRKERRTSRYVGIRRTVLRVQCTIFNFFFAFQRLRKKTGNSEAIATPDIMRDRFEEAELGGRFYDRRNEAFPDEAPCLESTRLISGRQTRPRVDR